MANSVRTWSAGLGKTIFICPSTSALVLSIQNSLRILDLEADSTVPSRVGSLILYTHTAG